uniref:Magnesium-protoporphyrin O-methyltransferase n=1 Tax=Lygus hesperus TaxID=30085 RepID=A0A0A9XDB7_LYGHE
MHIGVTNKVVPSNEELAVDKPSNDEESSPPHENVLVHKSAYDRKELLNQYLLLHYGEKVVEGIFGSECELHLRSGQAELGGGVYSDMNFGLFDMDTRKILKQKTPIQALGFPVHVAELAMHFCREHSIQNIRALDVGCATGRTSFELTRYFGSVLGVDYSEQFLQVARTLGSGASVQYDLPIEGDICMPMSAVMDDEAICRQNVSFICGDATKLCELELGFFNCVVAANVVDRLQQPIQFLHSCAGLFEHDGILVIVSPYTWSSQFTPKQHWLGGYYTRNTPTTSFDTMRRVLEKDFTLLHQSHIPMWIHETIHKTQYTFCHATVWRKVSSLPNTRV